MNNNKEEVEEEIRGLLNVRRTKALTFRAALEGLINVYSKENGSDTPDFILAGYLVDCLEAYDRALQAREKWYGRGPLPVEEPPTGALP